MNRTMNRMKPFFSSSLLFLALLAVCSTGRAGDRSGTVSELFLKIGTSARSISMGGAQVAIAEGVSSMAYNPAGIMSVANYGFGATYTAWLADMQHSYAGIVKNVPGLGAIGVSVTLLTTDDIPETTPSAPEGTGSTFRASDYADGRYSGNDPFGARGDRQHIPRERLRVQRGIRPAGDRTVPRRDQRQDHPVVPVEQATGSFFVRVRHRHAVRHTDSAKPYRGLADQHRKRRQVHQRDIFAPDRFALRRAGRRDEERVEFFRDHASDRARERRRRTVQLRDRIRVRQHGQIG